MSGPLDLAGLAPPDVIEALDFEAVRAARVAHLQLLQPELAPVLATRVGPLNRDLDVASYRELILRARVNDAARGNLVATAVEADLENLAANLGVARLDGEDDERLRIRTALAPEGFSVAGPTQAYEVHALAADLRVADVKATTSAPGQVLVTVLSTAADGVADAGLRAIVAAAVSADAVRPLTDQVTVASAAVVAWPVTATLKLAAGVAAGPVVAAATAALNAYAASRRRIGKGVARAAATEALMQPGVENLVLTLPAADLAAVAGQAPVLGAVTLATQVGGSGV